MTVSNVNLRLPELVRQAELPDILSDADLTSLISGSDDRRYGIVKRALKQKILIQIRRGLYILGDLHRRSKIHSFDLAQRIYGPSYISFQSALAHAGLIPEAVYSTTSGTLRRSSEFATPFGHFSFTRIPYSPLYTHVHRHQENGIVYFMAAPLRALCDIVYSSRAEWTLQSIENSLRLEEIPRSDREDFEELKNFYKNIRVQKFLKDYARRFY